MQREVIHKGPRSERLEGSGFGLVLRPGHSHLPRLPQRAGTKPVPTCKSFESVDVIGFYCDGPRVLSIGYSSQHPSEMHRFLSVISAALSIIGANAASLRHRKCSEAGSAFVRYSYPYSIPSA